jgi:hypothetical protein
VREQHKDFRGIGAGTTSPLTLTAIIDTASGKIHDNGGERTITAGVEFDLTARSLLLLRR